jgi:hypothetical protein
LNRKVLQKKQTDLERFYNDYLLTCVTLHSDTISKLYHEFKRRLADEQIAKINRKVGNI